MVYVVLAERGEYSVREVWVAGAYETEEAAQQAIRDRDQVRRAWDQWDEIENSVCKRAQYLFRLEHGQLSWESLEHFQSYFQSYENFQPYLDAELAKTPPTPEPEIEDGERFSYRIVEMGQWYGPEERI